MNWTVLTKDRNNSCWHPVGIETLELPLGSFSKIKNVWCPVVTYTVYLYVHRGRKYEFIDVIHYERITSSYVRKGVQILCFLFLFSCRRCNVPLPTSQGVTDKNKTVQKGQVENSQTAPAGVFR